MSGRLIFVAALFDSDFRDFFFRPDFSIFSLIRVTRMSLDDHSTVIAWA